MVCRDATAFPSVQVMIMMRTVIYSYCLAAAAAAATVFTAAVSASAVAAASNGECREGRLPLLKTGVHVFYYLWYDGPFLADRSRKERKYGHWNHKVLPHWTKAIAEKQSPPAGFTYDPEDPRVGAHSPFCPLRGFYSSGDRELIAQHFEEIGRHAKARTVVVSSLSFFFMLALLCS